MTLGNDTANSRKTLGTTSELIGVDLYVNYSKLVYIIEYIFT